MKDLYRFSRERASMVSWGTGSQKGSFSPKVDSISPKSVYGVFSDGRLCLNFQWLQLTESGQRAVAELTKKLRGAGFPVPDDAAEKFVGVKPEVWVPRLGALKTVLGVVIEDAATR